MQPKKIVVVGDSTVGKTNLIYAFHFGRFVGNNWSCDTGDCLPEGSVDVDGARVPYELCDTVGRADFDDVRPLLYTDTDVFILCFSVDNRQFYENIALKWHPEIQRFCPWTPFILVGTKADLRSDQSEDQLVSKAQGEEMTTRIKAQKYLECSSKQLAGIKEVFEEAVRVSQRSKQSGAIAKKKICTVI